LPDAAIPPGSGVRLSIGENQDAVLRGGPVAPEPTRGRVVSQRAGGTPQSSASPAILFERNLPLGGGSQWSVTQHGDTLTLSPVGLVPNVWRYVFVRAR
jgi:hypothetical protein